MCFFGIGNDFRAIVSLQHKAIFILFIVTIMTTTDLYRHDDVKIRRDLCIAVGQTKMTPAVKKKVAAKKPAVKKAAVKPKKAAVKPKKK